MRLKIGVLLAVTLAFGCAAPTASPTASPSSVPSVDRRSSAPPDEPTDRIKSTRWVVGTVTTGGSGPCYSLITDDGTRYALHATDGTELVKGTRMRIHTLTTELKIDCGPGRLVEMIAAEPLR